MTSPRFWREQPSRYRLIGSRCANCTKVYFPPRIVCPTCRRASIGKIEPKQLSGRGKIQSWTVVRQPSDGFELQVPYALALIEMEEGCRVLAQIVDVDPESLTKGLEVTSTFRKIRQDGASGILYYGYKFRPMHTPTAQPPAKRQP